MPILVERNCRLRDHSIASMEDDCYGAIEVEGRSYRSHRYGSCAWASGSLRTPRPPSHKFIDLMTCDSNLLQLHIRPQERQVLHLYLTGAHSVRRDDDALREVVRVVVVPIIRVSPQPTR